MIVNEKPAREGFYKSLFNPNEERNIVVSKKHKLIFMRIFKSAGTTIKTLLGMYVDTMNNNDNKVEYQDWLESMDGNKLKEYFVFACVRNPWDRLLSLATFFKIEWRNFMDNIDHYMEDNGIRLHSLPQNLYTHADSVNFTDMICHFETLKQDISTVLDRIDIDESDRKELPHMRRSTHNHYSLSYSESDKHIVGKRYSNDIKYYGYTFKTSVIGLTNDPS